MILAIAALNRGLYTVVAMSLVGSILSNLLLVLGGQGERAGPGGRGGAALVFRQPCGMA